MNIQWFPGHMKKSYRGLEEWIKNIDLVLVVVDSRAPYSCLNQTLEKICGNKEICYCFNKIDLADNKATDEWMAYFKNIGRECVKIDATNSKSKKVVEEVIMRALERKKAKRTREFLQVKFRVAIVGVPNTGKSTLLNTIAGTYAVKTGNIAGVTRNNTWIKMKNNVELMDNAGTLEPKFNDEVSAENLAILGSINDAIIDEVELATTLLSRLKNIAPNTIGQRYGLSEIQDDNIELLESIAKKKGAVIRGGEVDYSRVAKLIITDFRSGKMGKITLETVGSRGL